jgi:16S rRNA G527 N7-methylase RsmG
MLDQMESNYDCANANGDLPKLLQELEQWNTKTNLTQEEQEMRNRLENQIHFIRNKCDIPGEGKRL